MNDTEEDGKIKDKEANIEWSSFEQYEHTTNHYTPKWNLNSVKLLIEEAYPRGQNETPANTDEFCNGNPCEEELYNRNGLLSEKILNHTINGLGFYFGYENIDCSCKYNEHTKYMYCTKCSTFMTQSRHRSRDLWDKLIYTSLRKTSSTKLTATWRRHTYLRLVPIRTDILLMNGLQFQDDSPKCLSPLTSDTSDSEESDTDVNMDPIYSKFGVLRNGFYISEDGMVFCSQRELDEYNSKMAEMAQVLQAELVFIKNQHTNMKAKKSEERKLLSNRLDSQEYDAEDEPNETQRMNAPKETKPERKSALFSSIQDAFSYARTGFHGLFDKNSQTQGRSTMSEPNSDSEESGEEEDRPKIDRDIITQKSVELFDNHDEFTRQMTAEGGLKYQSGDNTVQQLSYQSLPPPLSLDALPAKTSNGKS